MKKTIAALLALVMALSLTACSKNETKKLVGTWQYAMDLTETMNREMAESYELEELDSAAAFCVYMDFTVAEDGAYTLGVDMGELLTLMLGSDAGTESAGWCKAVDGQLFMAETADELDAAGYVAYTLNSDGTMSWTDDDGQLSGQLTAQEQELVTFPMVWTKLA